MNARWFYQAFPIWNAVRTELRMIGFTGTSKTEWTSR